MTFVAEVDIALDQPQPLILGAADIAVARAVGPGGDAEVLQMRQPAVPQRARGTNLMRAGIDPRHLPVPAGQRQFEQRLAERLREFSAGVLGRGDVGDQRAQIDAEPAVEGALDRMPVKRRQHDAGDQQNDHRPGGGGEKQAQRERVGAHPVNPDHADA